MANDVSYFELGLKDSLSGPFGDLIKKGLAGLKSLDTAGGGLSKSLGGAFESLLSPIGLATGALVAFGAGMTSVIKTGMAFESQMSEVSAILNATADETKRLIDLAISLGASTSFSSSEVAKMFTEVGRLGFSSKQIEDSAQAILDLASATKTDLTRSGEIAIATLHQFGLEAAKSGQVVDMLVKAANDSAVSVESLGESLKYIGPNAHAMGVSLEEILAATGSLGDAGMTGSVATRALSTSLQRLAKPTKAMNALMDQLGISFFDSNGDFVGLTGTVEILEEKLKGASQEMRANAISTLFGNDAYGEMSVLLAKGSKALRTIEGDLLNTRGIARQTSKVMISNLQGDVEQFWGSWESFTLNVYGKQSGFYRSIVQLGTTFINRLSASWDKLTAPLAKVWDSLTKIGDAFKSLFIAIGLIDSQTDGLDLFFNYLAWGLNNLATVLSVVFDGLAMVVNGIRDVINWFTELWDASKFLASNMSRLFTPLGELIQGIFTFDSAQIKKGLSDFGSTWKTLQNEFWASRQMDRGGIATVVDSSAYDTTKPATQTALWGINDLGGGEGKKGKKEKSASDIDVVGAGGSGRSVVVNINGGLINNLTVTGANLAQDIEAVVSKALINSVRDFESSY